MALLLFHLRVGVRIAVRSFIPLFAAVLWLIMLQMNPAGLVTMLALSTFAPQPSVRHLLPIAVLAFLLPLWAAPRLSLGLNGWIRHLGFSRRANQRGLLLSLAMAQVPLWISLVALGFVAHHNGSHVWRATPRLCLLLAAAVYSALPATRRFPVVLLAFSAAACVFSGSSFALAGGILLLIAADLASGDIRELPRPKSRHAVGSLFEFRVSWRALGLRLPLCFVVSLLIIGATALFARNNELSGSLLAGAARFGACMAVRAFSSDHPGVGGIPVGADPESWSDPAALCGGRAGAQPAKLCSRLHRSEKKKTSNKLTILRSTTFQCDNFADASP
jgi:hypothetical protein